MSLHPALCSALVFAGSRKERPVRPTSFPASAFIPTLRPLLFCVTLLAPAFFWLLFAALTLRPIIVGYIRLLGLTPRLVLPFSIPFPSLPFCLRLFRLCFFHLRPTNLLPPYGSCLRARLRARMACPMSGTRRFLPISFRSYSPSST